MSSHPIVVSVPNGDLDPAQRFAATEAALHGTPVRLVHAYEPGPSLSGPPVTQAGATEVLRRALLRAEQVMGPGIEVTGGLVRGPAVESVLDASHEAWVVVLQRRDLLHLIRSLTRSMDRAAVRRAHLPLVCVPPTEVAAADDLPVTVGVDAPEHSTALLRAAVAIAHERGAPLRVLHTWSFPKPYDDAVCCSGSAGSGRPGPTRTSRTCCAGPPCARPCRSTSRSTTVRRCRRCSPPPRAPG